jgi:hypothetical protein
VAARNSLLCLGFPPSDPELSSSLTAGADS